jgi:hypothetical protein
VNRQETNMPVISTLQSLTLQELDKVKLLNRVDSKFIFHAGMLDSILEAVSNDYFILEMENKRVFRYESLYFDTKDFLFYRNHHNGKPNRLKIRYRKYVDSGEVYFEIKKKIKMDRTDKYRIRQPEISEVLNGAGLKLLDKHQCNPGPLEAKMRIFFDRLTLASKNTQERVTLDINLMLTDKVNEKSFPSLVIAEIKQERFSRLSKFVEALRKRNISELAISKYALSVALMKDIKSNAFKAKILKLNKLIN